jgi:hypothetical protein
MTFEGRSTSRWQRLCFSRHWFDIFSKKAVSISPGLVDIHGVNAIIQPIVFGPDGA